MALEMVLRGLSNDELIEKLRVAAAIWFKNEDLPLLEEMVRRLPEVFPGGRSIHARSLRDDPAHDLVPI